MPPLLSLVPPTDEAAQGWAGAPVWLVVTSTDGGPDVHVLTNAWAGLWEQVAAEAAAFVLEVERDGGDDGPGAT